MEKHQMIEAVCNGQISIHEAEKISIDSGFGPLEKYLDDQEYDPAKEAFWTISEALCWINSRNFESVKRANTKWRSQSLFFKTTMDPEKPYVYGNAGPITYLELTRFMGMNSDNIFNNLKEKVENGKIETFGIRPNTSDRIPIKSYEWYDFELMFGQNEGLPAIWNKNDNQAWMSNRGFSAITVNAYQTQIEFPEQKHKICTKKITVKDLSKFFDDILEELGRTQLPSLDQCFVRLRRIDPSWKREKFEPHFKKRTNNRGRGRPRKSEL